MARVALVLVAHSRALSDGVRELVVQMAPDVTVATAGGLPDGSLGTDLERVQAALETALSAAEHAVVLYDLGSAAMTAEIALEMLEDPDRAVLLAEPLVEGALAAAVAAQGGSDIDAVCAAVRAAGREVGAAAGRDATGGAGDDREPGSPSGAASADVRERTVRLRNPLGLHARPAAAVAALAASAAGNGTLLQVGRADGPLTDAAALLRVVGLSLRGGDDVRLAASGADAARALDDLAALVASGFGEVDAPVGGVPGPSTDPATARDDMATVTDDSTQLTGIAAGPGTAIGPVLVVDLPEPDLEGQSAGSVEEERKRSETARDRAVDQLVAATPGGRGADVRAMHAALLRDPDLDAAVRARLDRREPAAAAWWYAAREVADTMARSGDALLAERAADVRDVALRVLSQLGVTAAPPAPADVAGRVVVAEDVPPSWVPVLADGGMAGLALAGAGPTSHAVVLARGLAVPCVVALGPSLIPRAHEVAADRDVLLDGSAGALLWSPSDEVVAAARGRAADQRAADEQWRSAAQAPVLVRGRAVPVLANVASPTESARARREGADGVGLVRTELLLTDRSVMPSEDEQVAALVAIAREQGARRVVVRTFDVGGDKPVPALPLDPVRNGFLGERGLRLSLARPELLRVQLRAVLRAAAAVAGDGTRLALMAPMVTVADEVQALRTELAAARTALEDEGSEAGDLDGIGVMVEVPAAALAVGELAPYLDFLSVGTNDLVQYVMAAERTNASVAHLYQPEHPAVWRTLELLVEGAHAGGCEVGVCGQMAAEPALARRLVALGVDDLSVPPSDVGRIKAALRRP